MIRVVTGSQSAARDGSAIARGIPSRALMQRAGAVAAAEIALRCGTELASGVLVLAGPGNNGGDAWVVARALAATGIRVRVIEPVDAKTPDAIAERALAVDDLPADAWVRGVPSDFDHGEALVIDGLLGTGGRGALDGPLGDAWRGLRAMADREAAVVALDILSCSDAGTGERRGDPVDARLTITFGAVKRGHLVDRQRAGTIVVVDIGLPGNDHAGDDAPLLVDDAWARAHLPLIDAAAHKGSRRKIAIVGGAAGMAGATMLAARGAMRSGAGMVKLVVAAASRPVIQEAEPHALAAEWPADESAIDRDLVQWADAVVIGPGLGRDEESRRVLELVLSRWKGPTLLDADAITLFAGDVERLSRLLGGRPALLTPHPAEFARLTGASVDEVLANRFDVGRALAASIGACVLLKGVPTVVSAPSGECLVSATGTPALATGGSGDVLSGIAGTLLGQTGDALVAGALGAFVHGRAAERVSSVGGIRGIALEDVVNELRQAWEFGPSSTRYPVLTELPAIP